MGIVTQDIIAFKEQQFLTLRMEQPELYALQEESAQQVQKQLNLVSQEHTAIFQECSLHHNALHAQLVVIALEKL